MAQQAYKRALSSREIVNCENATQPACKCRCGGALHGARRVKPEDGIAGFHALPDDDPHHILTEQEKLEARSLKAKLATVKKNHRMWENSKNCPGFDPVAITRDEAERRGAYVSRYADKRYFACKNCPQVESIY